MKCLGFEKMPANYILWHASNDLFDSFDPKHIGLNSSKYGHGFYFCRSTSGARNAIGAPKYVYKIEIDLSLIIDFIKSDLQIFKQSSSIRAAALALKGHDPLSRHLDPLQASGNYLRLAAEDAASSLANLYSRDVLLAHGVKGFMVTDGSSEADDIVVVYDPSILRIRAIEFI